LRFVDQEGTDRVMMIVAELVIPGEQGRSIERILKSG
jgi:hypothetical protein